MRTHRIKRTLYQLAEPCANPKPDRRSKDRWECMPEFPAGLYRLHEREESTGGATPKPFWIREIARVRATGGMHYGEIKENIDETAYPALMAALVPVEVDMRNLQHTIALHPDLDPGDMYEVLEWLLSNGIVTPEQLTIAMDRVLEKWNAEEDE